MIGIPAASTGNDDSGYYVACPACDLKLRGIPGELVALSASREYGIHFQIVHDGLDEAFTDRLRDLALEDPDPDRDYGF